MPGTATTTRESDHEGEVNPREFPMPFQYDLVVVDSVENLGLPIVDPTWAKLVRTLVDGGQCLADLVGQWVFGGHGVAAGVDLDSAVAA